MDFVATQTLAPMRVNLTLRTPHPYEARSLVNPTEQVGKTKPKLGPHGHATGK